MVCLILTLFSKGLQESAVEELNSNNAQKVQNIQKEKSSEKEDGESATREDLKENAAEIPAEPSDSKDSTNNSTEVVSNKEPEKKVELPAVPKESTVPAKKVETVKPVEKEPNFFIIDTTNNRTIYSGNISYDKEKNLYQHTNDILTQAKIKKFIKSTGYVAMIDNLFDYPSMPDKSGKSDWASCGWIYYVNDTKANIGAKDYIPKEKDIIIWKYWKDAIYEK